MPAEAHQELNSTPLLLNAETFQLPLRRTLAQKPAHHVIDIGLDSMTSYIHAWEVCACHNTRANIQHRFLLSDQHTSEYLGSQLTTSVIG